MAYFEWDSSLSIGIDIIDEQHKRIIDYINELDLFLSNKNFDSSFVANSVSFKEKLKNIINELVDYTITHFAFEEDMMEKANYPFLSSHKKVHTIFTDRVANYQKRFIAGEDISQELLAELKTWLVNHIKKDDKDYSSVVFKTLNKKGWFGGGLKSALKMFFG